MPVAESESSTARLRSRLGLNTSMERSTRTRSEVTESTTGGWSRTTAVESVGVPGPGPTRASEPAPGSARIGGEDLEMEAGVRVQVVDGREEQIDAQGFRFREIQKVDETVATARSEPKEKKNGLRKIVGGLGFGIGIGGAKKDKEKKVSLRDVVGLAMEKEKHKEQAQKQKDKEEAYAQAALKWAERERELQAQGHTLPAFQSPIQSPTHTASSWSGAGITPSRSSRGKDSQDGSGSPVYRPPIRTVTQTSWTEPEEGGLSGHSFDGRREGGLRSGEESAGIGSSEEYAEGYRGIIGSNPWDG